MRKQWEENFRAVETILARMIREFIEEMKKSENIEIDREHLSIESSLETC